VYPRLTRDVAADTTELSNDANQIVRPSLGLEPKRLGSKVLARIETTRIQSKERLSTVSEMSNVYPALLLTENVLQLGALRFS
jgi:hypothetical protein